jgi:DnaJ-class molecular chaperone
MPIGLLRQMKEQREAVLETTTAELQEINKELARRQPKKKATQFVPYANDCGSCHGKPLDEVALCRDCNGTGEHQP